MVANGVDERPAVAPRDGPLRVGGVGRLTAQKGFDVLIEAVRRLAGEGMAVEAVIAGDGPDRAALAAAADGLPVELPGFVDDVPAFHRELAAFCLPSRWEGLPFALLEAMRAAFPASPATSATSGSRSTGPARSYPRTTPALWPRRFASSHCPPRCGASAALRPTGGPWTLHDRVDGGGDGPRLRAALSA